MQLSSRQRRAGIFSVVLSALLLVSLSLFPHAIEYALKQWMLDHGSSRVVIQDVDFNPFTRVLVVHQLRAEQADALPLELGKLELQFHWTGLFRKKLILEYLKIDDGKLLIENMARSGMRIGGLVNSPSEDAAQKDDEDATPGFSVEHLVVKNTTIQYHAATTDHGLNLKDMQLHGLTNIEPERPATIKLQGQLDDADFRLSGELNPFHTVPKFKGSVILNGIKLGHYASYIPDTIEKMHGRLDIVLVAQAQYQPDAGLVFSASGRIAGRQIRFGVKDRNSDVQLDHFAWEGEVVLGGKTPANELGVTGDISIDGAQFSAAGSDYKILAFKRLDISDMQAAMPQTLSTRRVNFDELIVGQEAVHENGQEAASLARYAKLSLVNVRYSTTDGLSIDTVFQNDAVYAVERNKQGTWNMDKLQDVLAPVKPDTSVPDANPGMSHEEAIPIRVGTTIIAGNTHVRFTDRQVEPDYSETFRVMEAKLESLDTRQPDQPSLFALKGMVGNTGRFHFSGDLYPFSQSLTLDIKGKLEGIALPPLSAYSKELMGYAIQAGKLDADVVLKSDHGKLDGNNDIKLYQVAVTPVKTSTSKAKSKPDVPLEAGLAMLRDKQNNIKLKLPITGHVDNIRVDPSDAINQALGKAMKQAAKSYLTTALFPYGTLLTVIELAGNKVMQVKLDPVTYEPGIANINSTALEYLSRVATILEERPEIQIKLCGVASEIDRNALAANIGVSGEDADKTSGQVTNEQLVQLAQKRSDEIETYLIDTYGIASHRLISCQPRLDKKDSQSKPRTELSL